MLIQYFLIGKNIMLISRLNFMEAYLTGYFFICQFGIHFKVVCMKENKLTLPICGSVRRTLLTGVGSELAKYLNNSFEKYRI